MSERIDLAAILALPVAKRIRLLEAIWDSIADSDAAAALSEEQRGELSARLADYRKAPDSGAPWAEVRERIRNARIA